MSGRVLFFLRIVERALGAKDPSIKILFISAEMNEIDLAIYVQRFPKFSELNILFVEADFNTESHCIQNIEDILQSGWDIIAIDSFYELQGIIKDEENLTLKKAESQLLSIIKKQNKAQNDRRVHTTFLTIQQVTKSGAFIGSNRLKHMITAMMELRLDNPKNIYSDRYVTFSKHRRGDVGVKLYYNLSQTGDVFYDEERYENDCKLRKLQNEVSSQLHEYADRFNKLFNNMTDDK